MRKAFQDAWLRLLLLKLPKQVYELAIPHIATNVLPLLSAPLALGDFFLHAFDQGSLQVSVREPLFI